MMFETHVGALRDGSSKCYLRPETAQGIFANFKNIVDSGRVKVPFGIAQIGKAFRNEITPKFHFPFERIRADGNRIFYPPEMIIGLSIIVSGLMPGSSGLKPSV